MVVLDASLLPPLAWRLAAPFGVGVLAVAVLWRLARRSTAAPPEVRNPLQLRAAIEMAVLFQVVLVAAHFVRLWLGDGGLLTGGFVLGLTDVDALTMAMTRSVSTGTSVEAASRAILIGVVANSLMKAGIAVVVGERGFARQAADPLIAMAIAGAFALLL